MHQVIELHFDPATEQKLRAAAARCHHVIKGKPHITLASGEEFDAAAAAADLRQVFGGARARTVQLSYFGVFPVDNAHGVFYAGVTADRDLCGLQEKAYAVMQRQGAKVFDFARPGFMVFHTTLAPTFPKDQVPRAMRDLEGLVPSEGRVIGAAVVEYPAAQELVAFTFNQGQT